MIVTRLALYVCREALCIINAMYRILSNLKIGLYGWSIEHDHIL